MAAVRVTSSIGDYRAGDEIWCRRIAGDWASAPTRDLLVPRPAGRFFFARLLNVDGEKLHLLPPGTGQPEQVVSNPPCAAVSVRLLRSLYTPFPFALGCSNGRLLIHPPKETRGLTHLSTNGWGDRR